MSAEISACPGSRRDRRSLAVGETYGRAKKKQYPTLKRSNIRPLRGRRRSKGGPSSP